MNSCIEHIAPETKLAITNCTECNALLVWDGTVWVAWEEDSPFAFPVQEDILA